MANGMDMHQMKIVLQYTLQNTIMASCWFLFVDVHIMFKGQLILKIIIIFKGQIFVNAF